MVAISQINCSPIMAFPRLGRSETRLNSTPPHCKKLISQLQNNINTDVRRVPDRKDIHRKRVNRKERFPHAFRPNAIGCDRCPRMKTLNFCPQIMSQISSTEHTLCISPASVVKNWMMRPRLLTDTEQEVACFSKPLRIRSFSPILQCHQWNTFCANLRLRWCILVG